MSTLSGISSSASMSYAENLAAASSLKRSLSKIGAAVESGDVTSAQSLLTAFIKAHPEYATSASTSTDSSSSTDSGSSVNQDFENLATALSNGDADSAKSAWATIKTDMAKAGVANIDNPSADTTELLAQSQASMTQEMVSTLLGSTSADSTVSTLLSATNSSSSSSVSDVLSQWLTYESDGSSSGASATSSSSRTLDTTA